MNQVPGIIRHNQPEPVRIMKALLKKKHTQAFLKAVTLSLTVCFMIFQVGLCYMTYCHFPIIEGTENSITLANPCHSGESENSNSESEEYSDCCIENDRISFLAEVDLDIRFTAYFFDFSNQNNLAMIPVSKNLNPRPPPRHIYIYNQSFLI